MFQKGKSPLTPDKGKFGHRMGMRVLGMGLGVGLGEALSAAGMPYGRALSYPLGLTATSGLSLATDPGLVRGMVDLRDAARAYPGMLNLRSTYDMLRESERRHNHNKEK
jgi:hypothetical protein